MKEMGLKQLGITLVSCDIRQDSARLILGFASIREHVKQVRCLTKRIENWCVCNTCGGVSQIRNVNVIYMYFQAKLEEYF